MNALATGEAVAPARPAARAVPHDRMAVAGLVLLALLLRVPYLGRSYWIDEAISIGIASHRASAIPTVLRQDGSPPLYFLLLHFWIGWFGTSEAATHWLSLLLSLAAVPAGYWAGRTLFDRRGGLGVAALMATNPYLNWYATETRMYTLMVLLGLVGVTLAVKAERERSWGWGSGAVAAFTALVYTHNWGLYLAGATAAVLLFQAARRGDRAMAAAIAACGALVLVLFGPWIPTLAYQARHTAAPWAVPPGLGDFFADPATAIAGTAGVVVVPLLALGAWFCRHERGRATAGTVAAVALLATTAGYLASELQPSWTVRYLAVLVGPYLLAAGGLLPAARRGRAVLWTAAGILVAWSVVGALLPNPHPGDAKDNMAALAAVSRPRLRPGDVVVVTQSEQLPVAHYYLGGSLRYLNPTGPVPDPSIVDWRDIVARLQSALPCRDLAPSIDALPVGADVLEIDPYHHHTAAGSAWSAAVGRQIALDDRFLATDPALVEVAAFAPAVSPKPYAPVDGVMYRKVAPVPSCPG